MVDEKEKNNDTDNENVDEGNEETVTIEETREELARAYVTFLDQQKGGIIGAGAGLGINLNPLQKSTIAYLTSDADTEEKGDILKTIKKNFKKNFKKKLMEKIGMKGSRTEEMNLGYDQAKLDRVKATIIANKDNKAELEKLINDIALGIDIGAVETTAVTTTTNTSEYTGQGQGLDEAEIRQKEYTYPVLDKNGNPVKINSPVGERGPIPGVHAKTHVHKGIDIAAPEGTPLLAVQDGEVESVGLGGVKGFNGYGNYIVLKLKNGYRVLYGHMKNLAEKKDGTNRKVGDVVKRGEQVGLMGSTGMSTGSHLHIEIRKGRFNESTSVNYFNREYLDPIAELPVTKDMVNEDILARIDQDALMDNQDMPMVA